VKAYFLEEHRKSSKSSTKAQSLRNDGNKQFQKKKYIQAVEIYTEVNYSFLIEGAITRHEIRK
jgi:hypothetical protein